MKAKSAKKGCGEMSKHYIYMIKCIPNGKVYIGQTKNLRKRWDEHKYHLRRGIHHSIYMQRAWRKYGEGQFLHQIIEECTRDLVDSREIYWISHYKSTNKEFGYNSESGGHRLKSLAAETKIKIGNLNRVHYQRTRFFVNSKESIMKRSISNTGKKRSEEFRRRMSVIGKTRTGNKNPFFRKKHSDETKRLISQANKGPNPKKQKPLIATHLTTGEVLRFSSRFEAEANGFGRGSIVSVIKGKYKQYKGYTWMEG